MEEQKNVPEERGTQEQKGQETPEKNGRGELPTRSYMLMMLGGLYIIYTGYSLTKSVLRQEEGSSVGFLIAGIVFLALGVGMVFTGVKGSWKKDKERKAAEAAAAAENAAAEPADVPETPEEPKKPMSIAERARLAQTLGDEEESGEED